MRNLLFNEQETSLQSQIDDISNSWSINLIQNTTLTNLNNSLKIVQNTKEQSKTQLAEINSGLSQISNGKKELLNNIIEKKGMINNE